jgi:hypothetical protein
MNHDSLLSYRWDYDIIDVGLRKKKNEYYSFEKFILFFIIFNLSNWNPSTMVSNHEDEEDSTNFYIHNVTSDVSRVLDEF